MTITTNKYILSITYDIKFCPHLDTFILNAFEDLDLNLDMIRNESQRQMYLYFSSREELETAEYVLITNASKKEDNGEYCLLDMIHIYSSKISKEEEEKIKLRKRIAEIYRRQIEVK